MIEAEKFYKEQELIGVGISPSSPKLLPNKPLHLTTPITNLTEGAQATLPAGAKIKVIRTKKGERRFLFYASADSKSGWM